MNILNIKQVAELLNLKESTIYAWVHRKKIPYSKLGGKLVFLEEQIVDFVNANSFVPDYQ